jgi:hypothetical protein
MGPLPQPRMGGPSGGDNAHERLGGNIAAWALSHGVRRRGGGFFVVMVDAFRLLGLRTSLAAAAAVAFAEVVRPGGDGLLATAGVLLWIPFSIVVVVVVAGGDLTVGGPDDFVAALTATAELVAVASLVSTALAGAGNGDNVPLVVVVVVVVVAGFTEEVLALGDASLAFALTPTTSLDEEAVVTVTALPVRVPVLCGTVAGVEDVAELGVDDFTGAAAVAALAALVAIVVLWRSGKLCVDTLLSSKT